MNYDIKSKKTIFSTTGLETRFLLVTKVLVKEMLLIIDSFTIQYII